MKVALYARVSTSDQNCAMQLSELQEYCLRRGWFIHERYVDSGWSGKSKRRPEFMRLMSDAGLHLFDAVIVWKLDRFGRSIVDVLEQLGRLQSFGVRFLAVSQSIDTDESNPAARLTLQILAAVAEFEHEMISERVRAGVAQAKRDGKKLGRPRRVVDGVSVLLLRSAGHSWREIADKLGIGVGTAVRACSKIVPEIRAGSVGTVDSVDAAASVPQ